MGEGGMVGSAQPTAWHLASMLSQQWFGSCSNPHLLLCLPQSLSPQDRAAYKEYISNVSLGAGWCWDKEGTWAGRWVFRTHGCSLCPRPHPLLQKRKSMTKLRGPNPKSSRTTLQSKSVRSPSQKQDRERGVRGARSGVAGTTDALPSLQGV